MKKFFKMLISMFTKKKDGLVGRTIIETGHCDTCPNEKSDCKKLILADGSHICVK